MIARVIGTVLVAAMAASMWAASAAAQERLALVVGIDKYDRLTPLKKATNDARAVGDTLGRLGFRVELALDVDRRGFNRALSDFLFKVTPGAIVYVHFSGHGVSIDNDTYLLPSDMEVPTAADREFVKREAVRLSELIDSLKNSQASARVVVIDACRDNPFATRGVRSIGSSRGLNLLPAPKGTLIMYSAADGQTALDTLGPNDREPTSVYTRALLRQLAAPGVSLVDMARNVRREVEDLAKTVGHEQRPAYYDELSDDLRLSPGPAPGLLPGINLPGSDYHSLTLARADAGLCQAACRADGRCASWTYVNPGIQGPQARCWLKAVVPGRIADGCCISGIEKTDPSFAAPPPVSPAVAGALRGIDLLGQDYRGLDIADPADCQRACRAETRCAAWTYVRPGVHGDGARCYLKHAVPARIASPCCVSGVERPK